MAERTTYPNGVEITGDNGLLLTSQDSAPSSPTIGQVVTVDGKVQVYQNSGWARVDGTAAGSLDAAYNGGATVAVDAADVIFNLDDASNDYDVEIRNSTSGTIAKGLVIDAFDASSVFTDAISIITSGSGATITDAIDASDAGITNAINVGGNTIVGTTATINFSNFDVVGASGNTTIGGTLTQTGAATFSSTITSQGAVTIDVDNAEAFLVRENGDAADVFVVDTTQDAGDTSVKVESKTTSGLAFHVDSDTTTGAAVLIDADNVTSGDALRISIASSTMTAAGAAISVIDSDNADAEVFAVRDDGTLVMQGTAEGTDVATITSGDVTITDGDLTLSGGEVAITDGVTTTGSGLALTSTITTSSAGAFVVTGDSLTSGTLALLTTSGTVTGTVLDVSAAGLTSGTAIDLSDLDAITTGKALHIDATGVTQTSGILVHIDSASTALTTNGRLLLVDATGDFNDAGGAVVEIQSVHTTGVGMLMTMDAVTDGFGLDMTADALTSGAGARFISSSTGLTTGGNVVYIQAAGDFNDAGGQVVEIESAHTTGTGLQLTMDAVTDGYGAFMTADALTSGVGLEIASSSTGLTTAGNLLHVTATGDFDDAGGQVVEIESVHTTGTLLQLTGNAITDGIGVDLAINALTTGTGIDIGGVNAISTGKVANIQSTSEALTSGILLDVGHTGSGSNADVTGNIAKFASSITDTDTSGTNSNDYDVVLISRTDVMNGVGGTMDADGAALKIETTATQTAGTLTQDVYAIEISHNVRSASDVAAIKVTSDNAGSGAAVGIDLTAMANGEAVFSFTSDTNASSVDPASHTGVDDWICVQDESGNLRFIPVYAAT